MKLTSHEKTILELISKHPDIVDSPSARKLIAKQYGFTEKTLRNRIGDLKKYGIIKSSDHSSKGVQKFMQMKLTLWILYHCFGACVNQ